MNLLQNARTIQPYLAGLRRAIHRNPEPGRQEFATAALIGTELSSLGLEPRSIAGTGVIVSIRGSRPGRCVALRADMDALPLQERTGLSFTSEKPGFMHACGHDLHVAALLGTARLLAEHREDFCGEIRLFFQPDEEGDGGAQRMIDEGCMEGVDAVFGAHVEPGLPAGTVGVLPEAAYAASNPFDIVIRGRSAHGAEPHLGTDAIVAASAVVSALQTLISRETSPLNSAVVSVGSFHAGTARNILADEARLSGIIRCFGPQMRAQLTDRLTAIVHAIAAAHGAEAEIRIIQGYDGIINDPAMTEHVRRCAEALLGPEHVLRCNSSMTTEDFGAFLKHAPGSYWHAGVGPTAPLHNPQFNPDESALSVIAAMHAKIALDDLGAPE